MISIVALASPSLSAAQEPAAVRPQAVTRDTQRAQASSRDTALVIPVSARPPAGMCRIWLESVPVSQQPAPTDCASAVKHRPAKGRVIFGDDYATKKRDSAPGTLPFVKGFAPPKPTVKPPGRNTLQG